jgi:hypothetical protein
MSPLRLCGEVALQQLLQHYQSTRTWKPQLQLQPTPTP